MGKHFRVPEEPKIVTNVVELITESAKLRVTVDPTPEDVSKFGKPKIPPFHAIGKLREVYAEAIKYEKDSGEVTLRTFVIALREALEFAELQEPVVEEDEDE